MKKKDREFFVLCPLKILVFVIGDLVCRCIEDSEIGVILLIVVELDKVIIALALAIGRTTVRGATYLTVFTVPHASL